MDINPEMCLTEGQNSARSPVNGSDGGGVGSSDLVSKSFSFLRCTKGVGSQG